MQKSSASKGGHKCSKYICVRVHVCHDMLEPHRAVRDGQAAIFDSTFPFLPDFSDSATQKTQTHRGKVTSHACYPARHFTGVQHQPWNPAQISGQKIAICNCPLSSKAGTRKEERKKKRGTHVLEETGMASWVTVYFFSTSGLDFLGRQSKEAFSPHFLLSERLTQTIRSS